MERKRFLDLPAPENYIPGSARGATGFTTRSDLGGVQNGFNNKETENDEDDENNNNIDQNDKGLLITNGNLDKDDEEAEEIYQKIEEKLQNKRKRKLEIDDDSKIYEDISKHFFDLKKNLNEVSVEEWLNLPEAGDMTKRNKRERELAKQQKRTYNISDSLITDIQDQNSLEDTVEVNNNTNLEMISEARGKMLGSKLDGFNNQLITLNTDDYLKELSIMEIPKKIEVGDISKSRAVFKSLRQTDPNNPMNWITSAKLEIQAKKFDQAKKIIVEGCKNCPNNEDIWLENLNIHQSNIDQCKRIITNALTFNLESEKLWIKAINLETDNFSQKKIIQKALRNLPTSINLWKIAINLETDKNEVKQLLNTVIEIIPNSLEFWLLLISLETDPKKIKQILNKARKNLPQSHEIWIEAAKFEETNNKNFEKVEKLIKKGVIAITTGSSFTFDQWFNEALNLKDFPLTLKAIITNIMDLTNIDKRLLIWKDNAKKSEVQNNFEVTKLIYEKLIDYYPKEIPIWRNYFEFLKNHENLNELYSIFEKSLELNPNVEEFWLRYAKEKWISDNNANEAKKILNKAFKFGHNINIYLAIFKLEINIGEYEKALDLLNEARKRIKNPKLWYKEIHLLRQLKKNQEALILVDEAIKVFKNVDKLYMQKGQIYEDLGESIKSKEAFAEGVKNIPNSINLWILLVKSFQKENNLIKANSILERSMIKNPNNERLWLLRIQFEKSSNNYQLFLNQAIKKVPTSPLIWLEKLNSIKKKSNLKLQLIEALKETNSNPLILCNIGKNFLIEGKLNKAKVWLQRAIDANNDFGDAWLWMYLLINRQIEKKEIDSESLKKFINDFKSSEPKHGEIWPSINKDVKNFKKSIEDRLKIGASKISLT